MMAERTLLLSTMIILVALLIAGLFFWGRGIMKSRKSDLLIGSYDIAGVFIASFALFGSSLVFSVVGILLFVFSVETLIVSLFAKQDCPIQKKERIGLGIAALILGCAVSTVDRHHQFGNPISKDKVVAQYELPPKEIWTAAKDVIRINGVLATEDVMQATLEGTVNGGKVWLKVEADEPKYTRLTVQARTKDGMADLALAWEIDKQIAVRVATKNLTPGLKSLVPPTK